MTLKKRKKRRQKKKKPTKIKERNPYALAIALRNGSGYHTKKKYNRNLEKRKQRKESEE